MKLTRRLIELMLFSPLFLLQAEAETPASYYGNRQQAEIYHPDTKNLEALVFVIPVYRELYSGNLLRLIASIAEHDSYCFRKIEILAWVNNTADAPEHVRTENLETFEVLGQLARGESPQLADHDWRNKEYAAKIMARRWRIAIKPVNAIDRYLERNIGRVRQEANEYAISLFGQETALDQMVLAQMDADALLKTDYIQTVYLALRRPDKSYILGSLYYLPDAHSSAKIMKRMSVDDAELAAWEFHLATNNLHLAGGTPRLALTAELYRRSGGFRDLAVGEDTDLIGRLNRHHWQEGMTNPGLNVGVNYRGRFDSYDGRLFLENSDREVELSDFALNLKATLEAKERDVQNWSQYWQILYRGELSSLRLDLDWRILSLDFKARSWISHAQDKNFRNYLLKSKLDQKPLDPQRWLDNLTGRTEYWESLTRLRPSDHPIFATDWFPQLIAETSATSQSSEDVYTRIKSEFPSVFNGSKSSINDLTIRFRAMTHIIRAHQIESDLRALTQSVKSRIVAWPTYTCGWHFAAQ